jgi:hypothetical protein
MYVARRSTYGYGATVGDARVQEPGHGHLVREAADKHQGQTKLQANLILIGGT